MSPEIWQDILTRMTNLRGDMVGQWQGDLDNTAIEMTVAALGSAIAMWRQARPPLKPAQPQPIP